MDTLVLHMLQSSNLYKPITVHLSSRKMNANINKIANELRAISACLQHIKARPDMFAKQIEYGIVSFDAGVEELHSAIQDELLESAMEFWKDYPDVETRIEVDMEMLTRADVLCDEIVASIEVH